MDTLPLDNNRIHKILKTSDDKTNLAVRHILMPENSKRYFDPKHIDWLKLTTNWKYYLNFYSLDLILKRTKWVWFIIYNSETWEEKIADFPIELSEKIWEYLRNKEIFDTDEKYRRPWWVKNHPFNCESFVYYVKWWFEKNPKLEMKYIWKNYSEENIKAWDVLYYATWDELSGEKRHYMIYIWEWFCISKSWAKTWVTITRHNLKWLYHIYEKTPL